MPAPSLSLVLPCGSLQDQTLRLMSDAGLELTVPSRAYVLKSDDPTVEARLLRAQEIARFVADGKFDAGITGLDWICETGANVLELADLPYSKQTAGQTRWVVAVPAAGDITKPEQLEGKTIATEAVQLTRAYLGRNGIRADVEFSWGATESKVPGLADAIVDVTETGSSLKANGLRELATIFTSSPKLIANPLCYQDPEKKQRIDELALALRSVILARQKMRMEMNVPKEKLDDVLQLLPAMKGPDVTPIGNQDWYKVMTVVNKSEYQRVLSAAVKAGAQDILGEEIKRVTISELPEATAIDVPGLLGQKNGVNTRVRSELIDFRALGGVVPVIVQNAVTNSVVMFGYMNAAALDKTISTGKLALYSRERDSVWTKGETNGEYLVVRDIFLDTEQGALLVQAIPMGLRRKEDKSA